MRLGVEVDPVGVESFAAGVVPVAGDVDRLGWVGLGGVVVRPGEGSAAPVGEGESVGLVGVALIPRWPWWWSRWWRWHKATRLKRSVRPPSSQWTTWWIWTRVLVQPGTLIAPVAVLDQPPQGGGDDPAAPTDIDGPPVTHPDHRTASVAQQLTAADGVGQDRTLVQIAAGLAGVDVEQRSEHVPAGRCR